MSEKLWGGRFSSDIVDDVLKYTETVSVDHRMLEYDIWQNIAHVLMLGKQGINTEEDTRVLVAGLLSMEEQRAADDLKLDVEHEDVHLATEQMLIAGVGATGGRMHTARSRNDQVQTDARMVTRAWILDAVEELALFAQELFACPDEENDMVFPGYTHSQPAQPISVAFWKAAHANALLRDLDRLVDAWKRVNACPLGACALAGTTFDLDRRYTADLLGFDTVLPNALDATSTRDWTVEVAAAAASGATNISRMQEEIVTWSSHEYGLVQIHDSFTTGSSIMPQKKNPVVAELARGKTGRVVGGLVQLLVMEKSVGLGYSCDLQEDKPMYWQGIDTYLETLRLCRRQNQHLKFDGARGEALCWDNFTTATELANVLVSRFGLPFRRAHRVVGEVVGTLITHSATLRNTELVSCTLDADHGVQLDAGELGRILDPRNTLNSYRSEGATGPAAVRKQQSEGLHQTSQRMQWVRERRTELDLAKAETLKAANEVADRMAPTSRLDVAR